jgi:hypothetical protein
MKTTRFFFSTLFLLALSWYSYGQVSITTLGVAFTDNFTSFAGSADPTNWTTSDVSSTSSWQGQNAGSGNSGGKYAYGTGTDYSLGFLPSSSRAINADIVFTNNTGSTITSLDISYVGEQWRSANGGRINGWEVSYDIGNTGSFTTVAALQYQGVNTNATGALDGNDVANRSAKSTTIGSLSIANGTSFTIRFFGDNGTGSGSRQGVAIDDFSLTANGASTPTTYTYNNGWDTDPAVSAPAATDNFVIAAGTATLAGSYSINDLSVEVGAALDMGANTLTVNGTATINADASGYGQVKGAITGTVAWETFLQNGGDVARWFNVAMPVNTTFNTGVSFTNGAFLQADGTAGQTNIYAYNSANITAGEGTWEPLNNLTGTTIGQGFSMYLGGTFFGDVPSTMTVSGTLLNGVQNQTISAQGALPPTTGGYGWNFVGNPYAGSIDWDAVSGNNTNITTTYWVQNSSNQWVGYNSAAPAVTPPAAGGGSGASSIASRYIAPGQAFFIQSGSATQINYAETDIALAQTPALLKAAAAMPNSVTLYLYDVDSNRYDFTFVAFTPGDSDANDRRKDAIKRFNNTQKYPAISTSNGQDDFIYNFTEDVDPINGKQVEVNVDYGVSRNLLIEANLDYLPASWSIVLEDKFTGTFTDLKTQPYAFAHTAGNAVERFTLHINKTAGGVGVPEEKTSTIYAYQANEVLSVNFGNADVRGAVVLQDINGRIVARQQVDGEALARLSVANLPKGIYLLQVESKGQVLHTQKLIK